MSKQGRKMFEIRPGQHRPKLVRNGAIFFLFMALAVYVMYFRPPMPVISGGGKEIQADLANETNIRPGYTPVRVAGIDVGQVTKVKARGPGEGARITMELEKGKGVSKVYADATAVSRYRTLLGRNHYIDLDPGSESAGELSGPIPVARTGGQVEVDEAIEAFDKKGRRALATMIDGFEEGFNDPDAVRTAIQSVAPAMDRLGPALNALQGEQLGDLPTMVRETSRAMAAFARDQQALGGIVDNGRVALGVTAAKRADLGATLRKAPATLRQVRSTAVRLRQTLDELDPVAEELRPGARVLDEAAIEARTLLNDATPLLRDAKPTFQDLSPALRSLRTAGRTGTPALASLQPMIDRFDDTLIPYFNETHPESQRKNFQMVGPTLASAAGLVARGDKRGALATFHAGGGDNIFSFSPCRQQLFNRFLKPDERIACELFVTGIASGYEGGPPRVNRFRNRAVPPDLLGELIKGTTTIKEAVKELGGTVRKVTNGKRGGR